MFSVLGGKITIRGITGTYGSCILNFEGNFHTVFQSGYINSHYFQQCMRVSFSPHPLQQLLFLILILAILTGVRWYLIVFMISISRIASEVEHLFMYLLAICRSSWEKCSGPPPTF